MPRIKMLANCQVAGAIRLAGEVVDAPVDSALAVVRAGKATFVDAARPTPKPAAKSASKSLSNEAEPQPPEDE